MASLGSNHKKVIDVTKMIEKRDPLELPEHCSSVRIS